MNSLKKSLLILLFGAFSLGTLFAGGSGNSDYDMAEAFFDQKN